jgi:hypothetical protein
MVPADPRVWKFNKAERAIDFTNGSRLAIFSLDNPASVLGHKFHLFVIDEAAQVKDGERVWHQVIRPTLADNLGRAVFISTPTTRSGLFWDQYQAGLDPERPDHESFHLPTASNPHIPTDELDDAERNTPELVWRQQYLAEFLSDGGSVFRGLDAVVADYPFPEDPIPGEHYSGGIDLAGGGGGGSDWTVFAVLRKVAVPGGGIKARLVFLDRWRGLSWPEQFARIKQIYDHWSPWPLKVDATGLGDPASHSLLYDYGVAHEQVTFTNLVKASLVNRLSIFVEQASLELPPTRASEAARALHREMAIYSSTQLPGGLTRYSAPPGQHDDLVTGLMLAAAGVEFAGADMVTLI